MKKSKVDIILCAIAENKMVRLKYPKNKKRLGGGINSIGYQIWNKYYPNDPIIANTGYVIHHIDENPNNNLPSNLLKMTDSDHKKYHTSDGKHPNQGKHFSEESKRKMSKSHLGKIPGNKGISMSEETKQKIRESTKGRKPSYGMLGKKWSTETREKMKKRIPWNKGLKNIYSKETLYKMSKNHIGQKAWNKGIKQKEYEKGEK